MMDYVSMLKFKLIHTDKCDPGKERYPPQGQSCASASEVPVKELCGM